MEPIRIIPLGAGQDVGRSCVLVTIGNKNIMFDCGMHMGHQDARRFPDFSVVSRHGNLTELIDAVIITHFHLDHCGSLPYLTERQGYRGPVYMTQPTKAICPLLLEDYRKISAEKRGQEDFSTENIKECMRRVITIGLHQTIVVDEDLSIKCYYAGHVLGAAMFHVTVGNQSVVYTGDFNMSSDRHLGSAWIDKCKPDILITESTYATTIRDSRISRERHFLAKIHECVERGGKIIIPVFALGRAQELCILLETYWERNNLKAPIYFSAGLSERGSDYYKLFINWTNEKIKQTFINRNMFEFNHIKTFDRAYADNPGAMVLLATPGMLHSGLSLFVFKKWAPDPNNLIVFPGYCVEGTVGAKVLQGAKEIVIDGVSFNINLQVERVSFSAHADAKGIMQLIRHCEAKSVVLVHGEKRKMGILKQKVELEFGIKCYYPANGESLEIVTNSLIPIQISKQLLRKQQLQRQYTSGDDGGSNEVDIEGILVIKGNGNMHLMEGEEAANIAGLAKYGITFEASLLFREPVEDVEKLIYDMAMMLNERFGTTVISSFMHINFETIRIVFDSKLVLITWSFEDDDLSVEVLRAISEAFPTLFLNDITK